MSFACHRQSVRVLAWGALLAAALGASAAVAALHVQASLIARRLAADEPHTVWIGVRMIHAPGWHTYWRNPGDAGMPTRIEWHLPPGWSAGAIDWPAPERLPAGPLASYGYTGELVLPVMLFEPRDWDRATPAPIGASVSWLVCRETCIAESTELSLNWPAQSGRAAEALFERFVDRTPVAFAFSSARAMRSGDRLEIRLDPARGGQFFPEDEELIQAGDPPRVRRDGRGVVWSARLGDQGRHLGAGARIRGIWVENGARPRRVEAAFEPS